ncbi:MAG: heat-stable protein [Pirellulaceae bacterium]|nr:MAG: heat-stable protein [Pirellulaceae bacterium]
MSMRKLLICGGIDGQPSACETLQGMLATHRPDAVLFAGGIGPQKDEAAADDLTEDQVQSWERFFQLIGESRVYTAFLPGWQDTPIDEFLQAAMNAEVDFDNIHCVHGTLVEEADVALCGIGGEIAENGSCKGGPWRRSRTAAEYYLRRLWASDKPRKFLLLGTPPTGSLGGDQGSRVVTELIDSYHPDLCAVLGCSSHRGVERVAHTYVVNPGRLSQGHAALFDWSKPAEERCELLGALEKASTTR